MSREKWKHERAQQRLRHRFEQEFFFPWCKRAMWLIGALLLVGTALQVMISGQEAIASLSSMAGSILVGFSCVMLFAVAATSLLFFTAFSLWVPGSYAVARRASAPDPVEAPNRRLGPDSPPPRRSPGR
jgi:uncharacterized BrkB/YihY/UPF0761 family membrane protein